MSTSTISTISTMVSDLDEPTLPNTWTPDSSPGMEQKRNIVIRQISVDSGESENSFEMARGRTLGGKEVHRDELWRMGMETIPGSTRNSVGIAF
jgi:hypothetical protein